MKKFLSYHLTSPAETRIRNISEKRIFGIDGKITSLGVRIEQSADAYVGVCIKINEHQIFPDTTVDNGPDDMVYFSGFGIILDNLNITIKGGDRLNVYAENVDVVPHRIDVFFVVTQE